MRLLLVSSAARRLALSSDQVRRLVDSGKLKATHAAGGVRLIDGDDVERLARERGVVVADAGNGSR